MDESISISHAPMVGIVTLVGRFNYGNRLQNYATSRIWEKVGYEPVTLESSARDTLLQRAKHSIKVLIGREGHSAERGMSIARKVAFERFDSKIRTISIAGCNQINQEEFAWVSVGSDQCWNPFYGRDLDWYYLRPFDFKKRVALAPSFGLSTVPSRYHKAIAEGLSGFDCLSVRETSGARIVERLSGREATVIVDPTMMLTKEEWRSVANDVLTPKSPYGFAYLLGPASPDRTRALNKAESEFGCKAICISDRDEKGQLPAGPSEFISLLANASFVVSDSFHACVFSILFNKPLIVVPRVAGIEMSDRIETLLRTFDLQDEGAAVQGYDRWLISHGGLDERIMAERVRFAKYLERAIGEEVEPLIC